MSVSDELGKIKELLVYINWAADGLNTLKNDLAMAGKGIDAELAEKIFGQRIAKERVRLERRILELTAERQINDGRGEDDGY
jgi:hypothetical protein